MKKAILILGAVVVAVIVVPVLAPLGDNPAAVVGKTLYFGVVAVVLAAVSFGTIGYLIRAAKG